jgi:predicted nucleotide-binding protein
MTKTVLFLGSSSAAKSQAKAVATALTSENVEFLPWWEAFAPGRTLLQELDSIRGRVHGAVLLFSPEAETTVRGKQVHSPNLNVLFEFGYFYGHFGKEKVALLKYGDFYLPSDFGGYIHIAGSKYFKRSAQVKVSKRTVNEFDRWIRAATFPSHTSVPPSEVPASSASTDAPRKRRSFFG